jgi:hypothetical protein
MSKSIGRTDSMNEHAGAETAIAAVGWTRPRGAMRAIRQSGLSASGRISFRDGGRPGSPGGHAAMTGQCAARCPVPASIPSVVRMVRRGGVLQHPPFGGGTPVAMGDAQWPARSEVPIFLMSRLMSGGGRVCAGLSGRKPDRTWARAPQPCGAPAGYRHRCFPVLLRSGWHSIFM